MRYASKLTFSADFSFIDSTGLDYDVIEVEIQPFFALSSGSEFDEKASYSEIKKIE